MDLEAEFGLTFAGEFLRPVSIFDMIVDVVCCCFCFDDESTTLLLLLLLLLLMVVVVVVVLVVSIGARCCSPSLDELKQKRKKKLESTFVHCFEIFFVRN